MARTGQAIRAVEWDGRRLAVLDQTLLPGEERWIELTGVADTVDALQRLAVRGAPLIGIVAGYGLALQARNHPDGLEEAARTLSAARPTAVNLARATSRVAAAARTGGAGAA